MHIAVVANGDLPTGYEPYLHQVLTEADVVVAVDGGLAHCLALEVTPQSLIGDLDSVDGHLVESARSQGVDVLEFPADKDATDLELALDFAAKAGAARVTVVTPFGGRLDHELATIAMLASSRYAALQMAATDGRRQLWVIRRSVDLALPVEATVSLVPTGGDVTGVTTTGLRWPLTDATLSLGATRGVSNMVVDAAQSVTITSGVLLAIADELEQ